MTEKVGQNANDTVISEILEMNPELEGIGNYEYGWADSDEAGQVAKRGLDEDVVRDISAKKNEPQWMLDMRLKALKFFERKPMPTWGADLSEIDFDNIKYFVRSTEGQAASWEELPEDIRTTYERLGIPEAERNSLVAGVAAQYESEVVYHQIREDLEKQGVIFVDTDTGLREYPELFKEYFGSIIPIGDNKFSALNTAVWSGGSFVYVPPGVHVEIPLQAYFRINTENMGQFERTLIIADEGSYVHYIEGCTAPIYKSDSLHSAVVEIVLKKNARVRYTTIQNWSNNVYNLVTKRAVAHELFTWLVSTLRVRPCPSHSRVRVSTRTPVRRWFTLHRTPPRPLCPSPWHVTAAAVHTVAWFRFVRALSTPSPPWSVTHCWWTPSPAPTPTPTWMSARTM